MPSDLAKRETEGLPPWMAVMRRAAMEAISEKDVADIVKNMVEAAKKGDKTAIKFVFEHVLGGNQTRGATFVQNNNYGVEPPGQATTARPGQHRKVAVMCRRAEAGLPLTRPDDGPAANLD